MRQHCDSGRGRVGMADLVSILGLFALEPDLTGTQITACVSTARHNRGIDDLDPPR